MTASSILVSLRDIEGVVGSFVVDAQGGLVAADLPAFFDAHALGLAGPRLQRLAEALTSQGHSFRQATLHFASHRLWLQPGAGLLLCVIVPTECNFAALRMGANLVARRLQALVSVPLASGIPVAVDVASASGSRTAWDASGEVTLAGSHVNATPPAGRSSGTWLRSRVPGASPSGTGRRQFRGRPIDEDGG